MMTAQVPSQTPTSSPGVPLSKRSNGRNTVLGVLLIIVCYQVLYQFFLGSLLHKEEEDGTCSGTAHDASSPQCLEVQLFKSWRQATADSVATREASVLRHGDTEEYLESLLEQNVDASKSAKEESAKSLTTAEPHEAVSSTTSAASPSKWVNEVESLHAMERKLQEDTLTTVTPAPRRIDSAAQFDASLQEQAQQHKAWEKNVVAEIASYGRELCTDPSRRSYAACAKFLNNGSVEAAPAATKESTEGTGDVDNLTPWARSLVALQARFESRMREMDAQNKDRTLKRKARAALYGTAGLEIFSDGPMQNETQWARELRQLQEKMQTRMQERNAARKRRREDREARDRRRTQREAAAQPASLEEEDEEEPEDSETEEEPEDMTELQNEALSVEADVERPLVDRIYELGRKLCLEPERRGRPSCVQFVGNTQEAPQASEALEKASAKKTKEYEFGMEVGSPRWYEAKKRELSKKSEKRWKAFNEKVTALGRELCSDPHRHDYESCAGFFEGDASTSNGESKTMAQTLQELDDEVDEAQESSALATTSATSTLRGAAERAAALGFPVRQLQWSQVRDWAKHPREEKHQVVFERSQLASAKWSGMIPKVACIAVIPSGRRVESWLKYFIENFRLQSWGYEGSTQLVLVYHFQNREARELLDIHADGTWIKGVPALGDVPSAAAFRYGAWMATDADIVARWDFDAWHHPRRLAMQVRALALSARPGCLLESWTVQDGAGGHNRTESEGDRWDGTLIGEAKWMREHWFPHLPEEKEVFKNVEGREIARVQFPELVVYDDELKDAGLRPTTTTAAAEAKEKEV